MAEVAIITRCLNRLEYTTQVVNAVKNNSTVPYEHIIIDQASTDGTQEWFAWMKDNTNWFDLRYVRMSVNVGDWKGMCQGLKYISPDSRYVVQLDNDIIPEKGWLAAMIYVLENTDYKVVMLKRDNVKWVLKPLSPKQMMPNGVEICKVERGVACFMARTELFHELAAKVKNPGRSKYEIRRIVKGRIAKNLNKKCIEIEAPYQRKKYSPKNPQVWEKL